MPNAPKVVRKLSVGSVEANTESKTFVFTASDDTVDRSGDVMDTKGWQLENFSANPVILLNHDAHSMPVGRAVKTWVDGNKLKVEIKFAGADVNPEGPRVEAAVEQGFLKALSVGFIPLESTDASDRKGNGWGPPQNYKAQELLEISVVTVPDNPKALLGAKTAIGPDAEWLRRCALEALSGLDGPGNWIPNTKAQELRDLLQIAQPPAPEPVPEAAPAPAPVVEAAPAELTPKEIAELVRKAIDAAISAAEMQLTGKID